MHGVHGERSYIKTLASNLPPEQPCKWELRQSPPLMNQQNISEEFKLTNCQMIQITLDNLLSFQYTNS